MKSVGIEDIEMNLTGRHEIEVLPISKNWIQQKTYHDLSNIDNLKKNHRTCGWLFLN